MDPSEKTHHGPLWPDAGAGVAVRPLLPARQPAASQPGSTDTC